ncbi:MAG: FtsW/RodA/SpoVE family cell cycle protein [Synergistaceae bacterium]|nr:FtsW/RodA/SpoVE family cell cycle protein [Synergistaceae bacterium]
MTDRTTDPFLWIIPLLLAIFGILMIFSLTSHTSLEEYGSPFALGMRQLEWLLAGICAMVAMYMIPVSFWEKHSGHLWLFSLSLLLLTLIPGIGIKAGGARRWIGVGPLRFQPIELATMAVAVHLSKLLCRSEKRGISAFVSITIPVLLLSVVPLLFQPNIGGTILIFGLAMAIHVHCRGWSWPFIVGFTGFPFVFMLFIRAGYRLRRYIAFLDPWEQPMDSGFQVIQGLVAFSNGGIFGVGVGKGLQKLNYLPAAHTDYIFAAVGEEFGFAGTFLVLFLFLLWTVRALNAYKAASGFHEALVWALAVSVLLPMFINLGGVLKLMPLTGIPLPFISYGGSSLLFMWARIGLLMRVSREVSLT